MINETQKQNNIDNPRRVTLVDAVTGKTPFQFKVSAVGDIQGEAVELVLTGKQLTRYRFKPNSNMRVVEDAVNVTQAEDWLQAHPTTWAALTNGEFFCRAPTLQDVWSDWYYFAEDKYLTNLWFLRDVAGAADATALVEAE